MVYLDPQAIISQEKLTQYLLIPLSKADKSQYLAQAGYILDNWQQLAQDLRTQILRLPALPTTATKYGQKYQIVGYLTGINGKKLWIKTIWIVTATETKFVTLFPN